MLKTMERKKGSDDALPDSSNAVAPESRSSDGVTSPVQLPHPPRLNISVLEIGDIDPPYRKWEPTMQPPIDIVQLTVKDVEFLNCYAYLENVYCSNVTSLGKVYFGEITSKDDEKVKVALLRCAESSATVRGSLNVTTNAIIDLRPKAIIGTGFCGGINPDRAKLGDVVISTTLSTYAHKKVTSEGEENRGVRVDVSRHMGALIHSAADGWKPPLKEPDNYEAIKVHRDREILSGPELVNNDERRKELLEDHPMAVGIEMEGVGIYAAAYNREIEWVVIKGISDYADGTKNETKEWQHFGSAMAASVVHNILKQPEILKGFTHYKKPSDQ